MKLASHRDTEGAHSADVTFPTKAFWEVSREVSTSNLTALLLFKLFSYRASTSSDQQSLLLPSLGVHLLVNSHFPSDHAGAGKVSYLPYWRRLHHLSVTQARLPPAQLGTTKVSTFTRGAGLRGLAALKLVSRFG